MAQLLPLTELFPTPVISSETSLRSSGVTQSCPTVLPLTTFFTPAPDCQNHLSVLAVVPPYGTEAYLGQFADQRSCYPSGLSQACLNPATPMIYSPGRCPAGWTLMTGWKPQTTQSRSIPGETTHLCCESGLTSLVSTFYAGGMITWCQGETSKFTRILTASKTSVSRSSSAMSGGWTTTFSQTMTSFETLAVTYSKAFIVKEVIQIVVSAGDVPTTPYTFPPPMTAWSNTSNTGTQDPSDTTAVNPSAKSHSLSAGAIAGIAVGSAIMVILLVVSVLRYRQHRRRKHAEDTGSENSQTWAKAELHGEAVEPNELPNFQITELETHQDPVELLVEPVEMDANEPSRHNAHTG